MSDVGQPPAAPFGRLAVTYEPIDRLIEDPKNAREHTPRQIRQIAKSISTFGFLVPVLVDAELRVLAGHGRVRGARLAKLTEAPVIRIEHLSAEQARAFMLADNKLSDLSTWNPKLLGETLRDLTEIDLSFDIEATGFSMTEIDLRIEGLEGIEEGPDAADAQPAVGPPVSRHGDHWVLGRHRLLCGDALRRETYIELMGASRAALAIADPPYNVPVQGHVGGSGATKYREFAMASGELSRREFTDFLQTAMINTASVCDDGSLAYWFMDWRHAFEITCAGEAAYDAQINLVVWAKTNPGMGALYRSGHELVFVFKKGRAAHRNNVELGRHGRSRSNVWTYAGAGAFGRGGDEGNLRALHPTVKPVRLLGDILLDATARGDIVLDPFAGSGSTIISAEKLGRECRAIELDPLYVDSAVRRWEAWTGEQAILIATGRSFAHMALQRAAEATL